MSDIGVKNSRENVGGQVLNVGQIFIEKMPKKKNAQRRLFFLIQILKK